MSDLNHNTTGAEIVTAFSDEAKGKTFVITGPSSGSLAAEAVYNLARATSPPAQIILLGRTESKVKPVIERINKTNSSIKTSFIPLDLSNNASVRECVSQIQSLTSEIDVLINSAGIMALEEYKTSADGFEMHLAACHIGHFLLTGLLLPQLQASHAARVVTLTSTGYEASDFRFDDWNFSEGKTYDRWAAYGQAKTANIMFTNELARRAAVNESSKNITAFVLHPGFVLASGIMSNVSMDALTEALEQSKAAHAAEGKEFKPEQPKTIEQGCATMLVAALRPELEKQSGAFLRDCQVVPADELTPYARDQEKAEKLWVLSEELVKEKFL